MENIILKIIASLISGGLNIAISIGVFIVLQLVVYQIFKISIVDKVMKLVAYVSKVEIGG